MIVTVDTETGKVIVDGKEVTKADTSSNKLYTSELVEWFRQNRGAKEYEGMVANIQEWYYGYLSKTAWCATAVSYAANQCGLLDAIGGKNENVYNMMLACSKSTKGKFYSKAEIPTKIKKGDILFWLWSGSVMRATSSKHVNIAEYDSDGDTVFGIGGNQKDKICTLEYNRSQLYAVFRIGGE